MSVIAKLAGILTLDTQKFRSGLDSAEKNLNSFRAKVKRTERQIARDFKGLEKAVFGFQGVMAGLGGVGVVGLVKMADQYNVLQARIKNATKETGDYAAVSQELSSIAKQTGASLDDTVSVFQRLSFSSKALGASNAEMLKFTRTVQQLGTIGGSSKEALSAGLMQLSQAMSMGRVHAEEMNSVMENLPALATRIEKGLGLIPGTLKTAVNDGKVLSKDVFEVILAQSKEVQAEFEEMPVTMERGFNKLQISMQEAAGKIDENIGLTRLLADGFSNLADWIDRNREEIGKFSRFIGMMGETTVQVVQVLFNAMGTIVNAVGAGIVGTVDKILGDIEMLVNESIKGINHVIDFANRAPGVNMSKLGFVSLGTDFTGHLAKSFWDDMLRTGKATASGIGDIWSGKTRFTGKFQSAVGAVSDTRGPGAGLAGEDGKKKKGKSAAEKEMDKLKSWADSMRDKARGPLDVFNEGLDKANKALKAGFLSAKEYASVVADLDEKTKNMVKVDDKGLEQAMERIFEKPFEKWSDKLTESFDLDAGKVKEAQQLVMGAGDAVDQYRVKLRDLRQMLDEGNLSQSEFNKLVKQAKESAFQPILTPMEQYIETVTLLDKALEAGALSQEQFNRQMMVADAQLEQMSGNMQITFESVSNFIGDFGQKFEDTLFSSLNGGKVAFKDFVTSAIEDLGRLIFKLTVTIPLANALTNAMLGGMNPITGMRSGGFLSSFLGLGGGSGAGLVSKFAGSVLGGGSGVLANATPIPGRATGGPVQAGRPYLVGEKRPELFIPNQSGRIASTVPGGMGGGPNIQITNHFAFQGGSGDKEQDEQVAKRISREINAQVRAAINDELRVQKRPGGTLYQGAY